MKNNIVKTFVNDGSIMIVSVLLIVAACNQKAEDPKDTAEDHNEAKFDDNKAEKDAQFLVEAATIDLKEIQLGELAVMNASSQDVKDLGKMMQDAHTKNLNDLQSLAANKSITIPASLTEDGQDDYKKLSEKKGTDFDKEFCDMMVNGHKDAVDKFEKASTDCEDADIKGWAASTLPVLRTHLDHAMTCQDKVKKM
ncbi:MAG: DUF4142 domain-containing protein [Bacteroidota bacterium]